MRVKALGLPRGVPSSVNAADLLPPNSRPTDLQQNLEQCHTASPYGITVICAPTGEGKTEAGLLAAASYAQGRDSSGWYFAMPTTATADGLRERLGGRLGAFEADGAAQGLQVIHSLAMLSNASRFSPAASEARDWLTGSKKAMLGSYGLGTVDQVLMGALAAKHTPLRLFALAASGAVIIDEAHAFDSYMHELLDTALEWMGALRVPVVLMSATLPERRAHAMFRSYLRGCGDGGSHRQSPAMRLPGLDALDA